MSQAEASCDEIDVKDEAGCLFWAPGRGEWAALMAILLLATGLRVWHLDRNEYGNPYYAASVRSMLVSRTNFFFGAFDPAGIVTVDKPPGALWIQALSARLLGYHGLALLLPQALLGVVAVGLTYGLVRRTFGPEAGLLAGLILTITPISVAVDRDNMPDTLLIVLMLLAAWTLTLAVERGRLGYLLASTALIGLAFNVKMLAAYLVLPTFYLGYVLAGRGTLVTRIRDLAAATLVLVAVSLSWSVVVELTPKDRRPYIGGSTTNSALELAMGYNGLGRIFGGLGKMGPPRGMQSAGGPGQEAVAAAKTSAPGQSKDDRARSFESTRAVEPRSEAPESEAPAGPPSSAPPPQGMRPDGGPGASPPPFPPGGRSRGPGGFGGMPGPLRFANPMLAGQITWLFPLAILGARLAKARSGGLLPSSRPGFALLLWAGWFGTHGLVFSFAAGIFHEYYTAAMGPAVAALAAIGSVTLRNDWRRGSGAYLVPATLMLTAAWQSFILGQHADTRNFVPVMVGLAAIGTAGLTVLRNRSEGTHTLAACSALGLLLIGPAAWSLFPVIGRGNSMMPTADPSLLTGRRDEGGPGGPPGPMPGMEVGESRRLVEFLRTNRHGETIFLAAPTSMVVSPIIIRTGEAAVSLGGFMGADPVLSKEQFARLVEEGQLRFVLIAPGPGSGGPGGPGRMPFPPGGPGDALGGPGMEQSQPDGAGRPFGMPFPPGGPGGPMGRANTEILMWVREHGKVVDSALWRDDVEEPEDGHSAPEGGAQAGPPINPNAMFRRMRRMTRLYDLRPDLGLIAANP